jgi:ABC-type polysaccharide/polyol phosphate transport system ATPase subunit
METKEIAISVDHVTMKFNLNKEIVDSLKEYVIKLVKGKLLYTEFTALSDVSFDVRRGEAVGIVGLNGSGKSTLLKVIAGVLKPTQGSVSLAGAVAPLIELGAGFNPNLNGRENVFLNAYLMGMSKEFVTRKYDEIVEFAELGDFMDVPVKNYSSGMRARLGFAIATAVEAPILIVDEVLSVGDYKFRQKCEKRMKEMISADTTLLFVSHNRDEVSRVCSRCVLLEKGKVRMIGPTAEVFREFQGK